MKAQQYTKQICGKTVAVVGLGVSNLPLIHFLLDGGAVVHAYDKNPPSEDYEALADRVTFHTGEGYLAYIEGEIIFKTPGIRPDLPAFQEAVARGAVLTSEMELFFSLCPAKIIAITGSDGKTTTTTLISKMLQRQGYRCFLGGNIGRPLLGDIDQMTDQDMVVVELSSFQLFSMQCAPDIAVITNIAPNHLDWHVDMREYTEAKMNLFANQGKEGVLVVNSENDLTRELKGNGETRHFSLNKEIQDGAFLKDGTLFMARDGEVIPVMKQTDIRLPGLHNVDNYLAAITAVWNLCDITAMQDVAKAFGGVSHRIEFVREVNGARYYNDSIASSPTRSAAGLKSFDQKIILIAGGYDKKIPFDDLGALINDRVKCLILMGQTAPKIKQACENAGTPPKTLLAESLQQAVELASQQAQAGDVVMLSPACASFDLFKNFEQRGNLFKEYVNAL